VPQIRGGVVRAAAESSGDAETAPAPAHAAAALPPVAATVFTDVLPATIALGEAQAPPATIPATASAPSAALPRHDFAGLVDRLTEARDIALSAQATQTVHAAIAHDVFGAVSLRFEAGSSGLSVALISADPDFSRAVQAAAPSASGTPSDEHPASHSRQESARPDISGQQPGGSQAFLANDNSRNSPARGGSPSAARAPFSDAGRSEAGTPSRPSGEIFA